MFPQRWEIYQTTSLDRHSPTSLQVRFPLVDCINTASLKFLYCSWFPDLGEIRGAFVRMQVSLGMVRAFVSASRMLHLNDPWQPRSSSPFMTFATLSTRTTLSGPVRHFSMVVACSPDTSRWTSCIRSVTIAFHRPIPPHLHFHPDRQGIQFYDRGEWRSTGLHRP